MGIMLYYALRRATIYTEFFKVILLVAMLSGIAHVFLNMKFSKKAFFRVCTFLLVTIFFYLMVRNLTVLILFVGMISCLDSDPKEILRLALIYKSIFTILFVVLGIGSSGNVLAMEIGMLMLIYLAMKENTLSKNEYLYLFILYIIGYIYTKSNSFLIIIGLMFLLSLTGKSVRGKKILLSKAIMYIFPILFFMNLFLGLCVEETQIPWIGKYCPDFFNKFVISVATILDVAMSSRLILGKISLNRFGVKWIGGTIDVESLNLNQYSYFYLDSGYLNVLQGWGILFTIIFMILMILIMSYLIKQRNYGAIIAGVCIAFWAINEPILTYIDWNFLLLIGGQAVTSVLNKNIVRNKNSS